LDNENGSLDNENGSPVNESNPLEPPSSKAGAESIFISGKLMGEITVDRALVLLESAVSILRFVGAPVASPALANEPHADWSNDSTAGCSTCSSSIEGSVLSKEPGISTADIGSSAAGGGGGGPDSAG
jgi:hypothetical protein